MIKFAFQKFSMILYIILNRYQMAENSSFNLVALQKNIQESLAKPQAKQSCLMFEYKLLLLYSPNFGIYVMPQLNNTEIWHGVVFVRFGLFKDAKFKFKILFDQFPKKPPKVYFISEVYHPNVNPQNGLLDLGEDIEKNWNYGTDHLIFAVVQHIRLIFLDVKFFDITDSYNKAAGQLFNMSPEDFFMRVRQCVETSKNQVYNNYENTSFKFAPLNNKHQKIKDSLKDICENQGLSMQEKKKKLMESLKQNY